MQLAKYFVAAIRDFTDGGNIYFDASYVCEDFVATGMKCGFKYNREMADWTTALTKLGARRAFRKMHKEFYPDAKIPDYPEAIR